MVDGLNTRPNQARHCVLRLLLLKFRFASSSRPWDLRTSRPRSGLVFEVKRSRFDVLLLPNRGPMPVFALTFPAGRGSSTDVVRRYSVPLDNPFTAATF